MSDETMVQRFERFVVDQCAKKGALYAAAPVSQLAADFAESEVRRALAPTRTDALKALAFRYGLPRFSSDPAIERNQLLDLALAQRNVLAENETVIANLRADVARLSQPAPAQTATPASLECNHCGGEAICSGTGLYHEGDGGHCMTCGFPGNVSLRSLDSETLARWSCSDEKGAVCTNPDCDECQKLDPHRTVGESPFVPAQPAPAQSVRLASDIANLSRLNDGWDSYDGKKPTQAALTSAARLQLCPVSDGGVQIECGGGSLEIGPDGKAVEEQLAPAQDLATRVFWIDSRSAIVAIAHTKEGCALYERQDAENNARGMANRNVYRITITAERVRKEPA